MLKSRLDRPGSHFDGTCNPSSPDHWMKKFLESNADIYCQHYTIDDNPNLDPSFVQALKSEYAGTVYYDRFILGKWCAPEGMIYRRFANDTSSYTVRSGDMRLGRLTKVTVGVDFGGNRSGTAFVACGVVGNYDTVIALMSERHMCGIDSDRLGELFCDFIEAVTARYGAVQTAYCDNAEPVLIRTLKKAASGRSAYCSDKARAEISGQRQDTSCQPADGAGEVPCDGGMRDADRSSVHRAVEGRTVFTMRGRTTGQRILIRLMRLSIRWRGICRGCVGELLLSDSVLAFVLATEIFYDCVRAYPFFFLGERKTQKKKDRSGGSAAK